MNALVDRHKLKIAFRLHSWLQVFKGESKYRAYVPLLMLNILVLSHWRFIGCLQGEMYPFQERFVDSLINLSESLPVKYRY
uniref:ABC transporter permease n=1 Tax=Heterorhabditis bacteriophora TaxID=37862 RepID=A0A1I7X4H0_HETBA